jgi:serine/threonine-protein phosphatase 4 catalytic subunit
MDLRAVLSSLLTTPNYVVEEKTVKHICQKAREIFIEEANVLHIDLPVTIVGDLHGQFSDLKQLYTYAGDPEKGSTKYLFLGDFVDRGTKSVETFLFLLCLKIAHRDKVWLLRGNHESRQITQVYGFYDECVRKYNCGAGVWQHITETFDYLPLAALVEGAVWCVHGGLSKAAQSIDEVRTLDRRREVPHDGGMCELLWGDPEEDVHGFRESPRGAGFEFGPDAVDKFHQTNGTDLICRSHQLVAEGYRFCFNEKLVTVWSAPNYCYRCDNKASYLEIGSFLTKRFNVFVKSQDQDAESAVAPTPNPPPDMSDDFWL